MKRIENTFFFPFPFGLRNVSGDGTLAESIRSLTIRNVSRLTEVLGGKGHVIYLLRQHTLFIFAGMFSRFGLKTFRVNRAMWKHQQWPFDVDSICRKSLAKASPEIRTILSLSQRWSATRSKSTAECGFRVFRFFRDLQGCLGFFRILQGCLGLFSYCKLD